MSALERDEGCLRYFLWVAFSQEEFHLSKIQLLFVFNSIPILHYPSLKILDPGSNTAHMTMFFIYV